MNFVQRTEQGNPGTAQEPIKCLEISLIQDTWEETVD